MTLIVGFAPGRGDHEAIELAATLARSAGQDLLVVSVVPASWPTPVAGGTDREFEQWATRQGQAAVAEAERLLAEHCPDLTSRATAVPARSVPSGLIEQAQASAASMVIVGSGNHGSYGHVVVSSTSDRLLHSSPVPVAVATRGYRAGDTGRILRATCAYRGDEPSRSTLVRAAEVCARAGAALRVVTFAVRGRTMYPPEVGTAAEDMVLESWAERARRTQDEAIAALEVKPAEVTSEVATGRSWREAVDQLAWEREEVLVIGSSSANPVSRLFLGSNATKIVRHSPVPVIVVR